MTHSDRVDQLLQVMVLAAGEVAVRPDSTRESMRAALDCALGNRLVKLTPRHEWPAEVATEPPYEPAPPTAAQISPPPKLKREWVGRKVRTRRELRNGMGVIPAGTVCEVCYNHSGLSLSTDPCDCCGIRVLINKVPESAVELLSE